MSDVMNNIVPDEGAVPAFASVDTDKKAEAPKADAPAFAAAPAPAKAESVKYVEPVNVFAQGLPEWSLEPPQVVVRRK